MGRSRPLLTRAFLVALATLFWSSVYVYVPILAPYVERLGGSLSGVGAVLAAYGLTQLALRLPLGIWSDRLGRRRLFVVLGAGAAVVSGLGFYGAVSTWQAFLWRATAGVAATTWVAFTPIFAAAWPQEQTNQAMGAAVFASAMGQLLAMSAGGVLAREMGWRPLFLVGAGLGGLSLLGSLGLPEARATAGPARTGGLRRHLTRPLLLQVSALAALTQLIVQTTAFGFTNTHAVRIGVTETGLAYLGIAATLPGAVASMLSGRPWLDRIGTRWLVGAGFFVNAAAVAAVPWTRALGPLLLAQTAGSVARGFMFPVLMGDAMRAVPPELRAGSMGVYQSVYAAGMFVGPLAAGAIGNRWGLGAVFGTTAALAAMSGLLVLSLPMLHRRLSRIDTGR